MRIPRHAWALAGFALPFLAACGGGGSGTIPPVGAQSAPVQTIGSTASNGGASVAAAQTPSPPAAGQAAPSPLPLLATPQPPPAPSSGAATYDGCSIFTPGDVYNQPVTDAPVDPHSSEYIASMVQAGDTAGFYAAAPAVEFVNVATPSTPQLAVAQKVPYHAFPVPYPVPSPLRIEPLSDAHLIVLEQGAPCHLFEAYDATLSGGVLSAYSGANWDLSAPFVPLPPGAPSAMASGLSLFAGMVKWEEVQSGVIDHALDWGGIAGTVSQYGFVRPASDTDGIPFAGSSPYRLPYGARLRLRASFDISHFGPQARAIAQAMKTYGIILADTGTSGNAVYDAAPLSGPDQWSSADLAALGAIHISDFQVLTLPPIQRVPGH